MSQSEKPPSAPRPKTPRVPANLLYERVIPIALIGLAVALIAVVIIAVLGLIGAVQ